MGGGAGAKTLASGRGPQTRQCGLMWYGSGPSGTLANIGPGGVPASVSLTSPWSPLP